MGGIGCMRSDAPSRTQMLEKRMDMMQTMMQMAMDRMSAAPTK